MPSPETRELVQEAEELVSEKGAARVEGLKFTSQRTLIGAFVAFAGVAVVLLAVVWQAFPSDSAVDTTSVFGATIDRGAALIVVAAASGGLGASLQVLRALASLIGYRAAYGAIVLWGIGSLVSGAALGVIFYFAFRGGFLSSTATAEDVNAFGVAAFCGLAGLYSGQVAQKLWELSSTILESPKPDRHGPTAEDELSAPANGEGDE